jgi:PKD repeat protein
MLINYGDGAPLPLNPPSGTVPHTYSFPGTYTVLVTATDSTGASGQATTSVTIGGGSFPSGQPPANVQIINPPDSASVGQPASFSAATAIPQNPGAFIQSYVWNFGDGGAANGQNVNHVYVAPGLYPVTLTVTDSTGASGQTGTQIQIFSGVGPSPSASVTYQTGWNLIAAPTGTLITGALGPLYTLQSGSSYQTTQSTESGLGYWAFFAVPTTVSLAPTGPVTITRSLQPGLFIMIGNPGSSPATVSGADVVYTYSAATGYQATTVLLPGQGAWALSLAGGNVTIASSGS